ncbi:MAG: hypothetical protein U9O65_01250 [Thermotogota bacterium]|nr:hypothetical protein [Thermotogota bacterium]
MNEAKFQFKGTKNWLDIPYNMAIYIYLLLNMGWVDTVMANHQL